MNELLDLMEAQDACWQAYEAAQTAANELIDRNATIREWNQHEETKLAAQQRWESADRKVSDWLDDPEHSAALLQFLRATLRIT